MNTSSTRTTRRRVLRVGGLAVLLAASAAGGAAAAGVVATPPPPGQTVPSLPPGTANPLIASGVAIGSDVALYKSSGLGPAALNTTAAAGTPEAYLDPALLVDGALPPGVTLTEAQSINALRRIGTNLASQGLTYADVITMRVFLNNAPGTDRADYTGWNRAYRQFFANTDLTTGAAIDVPLGSAAPAPALVVNGTRPSRFAVEVASLTMEGWLVEVEVDAAYPEQDGGSWHPRR